MTNSHWIYLIATLLMICSISVAFGLVEPPDYNKSITVGMLYIAGIVTAIWGKLKE